jgi:tetratricopeptide (TPR) repeat protein
MGEGNHVERRRVKEARAAWSLLAVHVAALALIAAATFLAYADSLDGTWAMDDRIVAENQRPSGDALLAQTIVRRVTNLSFLINHAIDPTSPVNYRVVNIAVHVLAAFALYWLAWKTVQLPRFGGRLSGDALWIAGLSAGIFALHPININAVAYIIQRAAALATLFTLLALLAHLYATVSTRRWARLVFRALTAGCVLLAIFAKENGVLAVPLLVLYDAFFLDVRTGRQTLRRWALLAAVGLAALVVADQLMHLRASALSVLRVFARYDQPVPPVAWTAVDADWTPLEHVLTACRVVMRYLAVIVFPLPRFLVFDWWGFPLSRGLGQPVTTLLSVVAILALVVVAVWQRRRAPLLAFGLAWYLIAISLESFVAVGSDLYFEHRNHLPMAGLTFGVVGQCFAWLEGRGPAKRWLPVVGMLCVVGLGFATFQRNRVWTDSLVLWKDTAAKAPTNLRAKLYYGFFLFQAGDPAGGEALYREVLAESPPDRRSLVLTIAGYNLGLTYLFRGDRAAAREVIARLEDGQIEESHKLDILKGLSAAVGGDARTALGVFDDVIARAPLRPDKVAAYVFSGDTLRRAGQLPAAIERYQKAVELDPAFAPARYGLAMAYRAAGQVDRAVFQFQELVRLEPSHVEGLCELADLMMLKRQPRVAVDYGRRAAAIAQDYARPYLAIGNGLLAQGRAAEAHQYYRGAVDRGLNWPLVSYNQGNVLLLVGDRVAARARFAEVVDAADAPTALRNAARQMLATP